MTTSPLAGIVYLIPDQNGGEVKANDAFNRLEAIGNLRIIDRSLTAPPGGESEGDVYLVGASATGDWATHDDELALYYGGGWIFVTPTEGWRAWLISEELELVFDGTDWIANGESTMFAACSTNTAITTTSIAFDSDIQVGNSFTRSTGTITVTHAGTYEVSYSVGLSATGTTTWTSVTASVSNAAGSGSRDSLLAGSKAEGMLNASCVVVLTAGTTLTLDLVKTGAATINAIGGESRLTVRRIK